MSQLVSVPVAAGIPSGPMITVETWAVTGSMAPDVTAIGAVKLSTLMSTPSTSQDLALQVI